METEKITPLLIVLRACSVAEQEEIAKRANTTRNYLYQIATCHRTGLGVGLATRIVKAVGWMHARSLGRIPKVTVDELATQCDCFTTKETR